MTIRTACGRRRFAQDTEVSTEKSRIQIETMLRKQGATGFVSGWQGTRAHVGFLMENRNIRFTLNLPARTEFVQSPTGKSRSIDNQHKAWEQASRQAWRALALVIKAKLEAIAAGISVFEDEFLANIVLPTGETVADTIRSNIALAYQGGRKVPLLPDYTQ